MEFIESAALRCCGAACQACGLYGKRVWSLRFALLRHQKDRKSVRNEKPRKCLKVYTREEPAFEGNTAFQFHTGKNKALRKYSVENLGVGV